MGNPRVFQEPPNLLHYVLPQSPVPRFAMKCRNCGADVSPARGECEYCGGVVDAPKAPDLPKAPEPRSREAAFERICTSPQYARRNSAQRHAALPTMSPLKQVGPVIFLIVFICIAGFIGMTAVGAGGPSHTGFGGPPSGGPGAIFVLVPVLFVAVGVVLLVKHVGKMGRFSQAETKGEAAIIVSKRTAVSGGGDNSSASTTYNKQHRQS